VGVDQRVAHRHDHGGQGELEHPALVAGGHNGHHGPMRPFDVPHRDPAPLARAAAVRSRAELDPATREHAKRLTSAERLREGFALGAFAARLRARAR
jgi:hypothetical protein